MAMYNKASYCSHLPLVEISLVYCKNILVPLQFLLNKLVCFPSKGFTALSIIRGRGYLEMHHFLALPKSNLYN